VNASNSVVNNL